MESKLEPSPQQVKSYQRIKLSLSISAAIIDAALLITLIITGWSSKIFLLCVEQTTSSLLQYLLYLLSTGIILSAISFPLSFISSYVIEHKFNLSNQTIWKWILEELKGLLIAIVIGTPVMIFFYWCLVTYQNSWWLPMSIALIVLSILLSRIAPIFILPLFYKLKPITDSQFKERILSLCNDQKLHITGIFEFNLSKDTKKANAAFTGIGKSKRILLADTLLQSFTEDEIISIFAHELGHYKYRHIWKGIALSAVHTFITFFLSSIMFIYLMKVAGFEMQNFVPALPLLALSLSLIGIVSAPFFNAISRKHEREADAYAVRIFGKAEPFISGLERLATMNLADKEPHPLIEFLFYSHPSIQKRILSIQQNVLSELCSRRIGFGSEAPSQH